MSNIELVERELAAAKTKHPKFCDRATYFVRFGQRRWAQLVASQRANNEDDERRGCLSAHSILIEELFEALEAYAAGRMADARVEWAQVAAVAIRAMEMCDREGAK